MIFLHIKDMPFEVRREILKYKNVLGSYKILDDLDKVEDDYQSNYDKISSILSRFISSQDIVHSISFMILSSIFHIEENFASNVGIVIAVLFAYFTNRKLVFNSTASTFIEKLKEFGKFILGRAFTMIVESVGFWLLFSILNITYFDGLVSKLIISVIVIILNFFISKFFAFKK